MTLTYADGRQARFINSDLSAARRPKFYALGTSGAIVGEWDPAAEPAVADLPARLTLHVPGAAPHWNNVGESTIEHRNMSNKSGVKNVV